MNTTTQHTEQASFLGLLKQWANGDFLMAIAIAVCILIATAIVTHVVTKILRKALSHENSPLPQSTIFINIWRVCGWGIGLSFMLSTCFGIDVTGMVAALGVGGIALSLGLQDTISNLIGGIQMSLMGTVVPGDHVEIGGRKGLVRDVKWRQVSIETANGQTVIVPNSAFNNGTLVKLPPAEKIIVPINLYKNFEDIDATVSAIEKDLKVAVEKVAPVTKDPRTQFTMVSEYSYTGTIVFWVDLTDLPYAATLDILDVAVRVVAKHSPSV